jgi:hypothetical protein
LTARPDRLKEITQVAAGVIVLCMGGIICGFANFLSPWFRDMLLAPGAAKSPGMGLAMPGNVFSFQPGISWKKPKLEI